MKYLARYTHRAAISNQRLVGLENGQVTFWYKDYGDGNQQKQMTISAVEFLRRFLLHILPSGFMRIRYYGFLANGNRKTRLARCRELLTDARQEPLPEAAESPEAKADEPAGKQEAERCCPKCSKGRMHPVRRIPRRSWPERMRLPWPFDTS